MLKYSSWTGNNMVRKSALEKALESGCVSHRNHRYAFFLRLAYEEIILRQYSRNLIFVIVTLRKIATNGKMQLLQISFDVFTEFNSRFK